MGSFMAEQIDISSFIFDNIQKFFFPEDWIDLDRSLSKVELLSLYFIGRNGDITMTRLAESLGFALSTATGIVDRLVKQGYVRRSRAEADRRIVVIALSEKGIALIGKFQATIRAYIDEIQRSLSEEERAQAFQLIMKILRVFQRKPGHSSPPAGSVDVREIPIE
jgi:DNA-binding MarR family transcriptional regulator